MENLVTQNVMHVSLCHMTGVRTGWRNRWGAGETGGHPHRDLDIPSKHRPSGAPIDFTGEYGIPSGI